MSTLRYAIEMTGQIESTDDQDNVIKRLAKRFNTSEEKAAEIAAINGIFKRDLAHDVAYRYKKAFEECGLIVNIKKAPLTTNIDQYSLVPLEEKEGRKADQEEADGIEVASAAIKHTQCPSCGSKDINDSSCGQCGIYFSKFDAMLAKQKDRDNATTDRLTLSSVVLCVLATIAGAMIWKAIAIHYGYEFGLVAWGIGGVIGMCASLTKSSGDRAAYFCACLALCSIMLGRFLFIHDLQSQALEAFDDEIYAAEFQAMYDEESQLANRYALIKDSAGSTRQFMIDHGYTHHAAIADISQDELDDFLKVDGEMLERMASSDIDFDTWMHERKQQISSAEIIKAIFIEIDILTVIFLFLSVTTAFSIGRGYRFA